MKKRISNIWLALVVSLVILAPASARIITVEVTGVVEGVATHGGLALDGSVNIGSIMTGSTTYDTDTPDQILTDFVGRYELISISMTVGNYIFTHDPMSSTSPFFDVYPPDIYVVRSHDPSFDGTVYIDGSPRTFDEVNLDPFGLRLMYLVDPDSIATDELPSSFPDISTFTTRDFAVGVDSPPEEPGFAIWGEVTSLTVVPEPATYYVDAVDGNDGNDGLSPETALATIQAAIDISIDGDTVIVAPGTYTGHGNRDIDFYGLAITVQSIDPNDPNIVAATIIDCDGSEEENHRGFYFHNGEGASSVLDGFTIANGHHNKGGGIYCYQASPTITNCTITGNKAAYGGGICCWGWDSSPAITNCTINANSAQGSGGGINGNDSSLTITNCKIAANLAGSGGGVFLQGGESIISDCNISGNSARYEGGGIHFNDHCGWGSLTINKCTIICNKATNRGGGVNYMGGTVIIASCTISGNLAVKGGGIYYYYSSPTVTNCTFSGNTADFGGGMYNLYGSPTVTNCTFSGNSADSYGGGIYFGDSTPIVSNCTFAENSASNGNALACDSLGQPRPSNVQMTNCILANGGDEIWNNDGSTITINYSNVQDSWPGEGNIDADPCFVEPGYWDTNGAWVEGDYHLLAGSPCINTGNPNGDYTGQTDIDGDQRVINGRVDMGADEFRGPIYVDNDAPEDPGPNDPDISDSNENGSLSHPFDAIQEAIDIASNGETVVVLDGTYTGDGNRDIDFLGKAIIVRSTDPNDPNIVAATIIDCNGTEAEPHRGFYFHNGEDASSVLDGFTITNGYGQEEQMPWGGPLPIPVGGAFFCANSSPRIANCIIEGNSAAYGGAFFCDGSSMILINCTISGNFAGLRGGGMYNYQSNGLTVTNCTFINNCGHSAGGGVQNSGCSPLLTNCTFTGNRVLVTQITFGGGGAVCNSGGSPVLANCVFVGNRGAPGGAVCNEASTPQIINCTFSGNVGGGNAMCNWSDTCNPTVRNCILWNGSNEIEIVNQLDATIDITYSDVRGGWPGEGNIEADPCFIEPGYWDTNELWVDGDYHLLRTSLCIDAANDANVYTDIEGNIRPFDFPGVDNNGELPEFDMGAYEAMASCFGVNHIKIETKDDKKGNKVDIKGTFSPALPIDLAVDDVAYIIDDGLGNALAFLIPAGSFEVDGKPDKQKFKFHSAKGSQPDIKARFDFDKCKFELKAKRVQGTDEITGTTLTIELWAGANVAQEMVKVKIKPRHTEYKRRPKLSCCPKCKGIALLEVTSDQGVFVFEPEPGKDKLKANTVVDDGVNGRVKIDTSCSKPLEVGDVFGVYTVTDLIKIFDD